MRHIIVVQGAKGPEEVPGISAIADQAELRFAPDEAALRTALPGADVLLGWNFKAGGLKNVWDQAQHLKWIHWSGAGVDAVLFDELRDSDITLTNVRGAFDRPMAEWTLGHVIGFAKGTYDTFRRQGERRWEHRETEMIQGKSVLIVGVGSIGRECARVLGAMDMIISGVGRTARKGDPDFGEIHAVTTLSAHLPEADYVILITPLTEDTRGLFGADEFAAMKKTARFINIGRGPLVDEAALVAALENGEIAGAALDVFVTEPLPEDSPFWDAPNCIVSPHMSGDFVGFESTMTDMFIRNLARYERGEELVNVVDKAAGFVAS